MWTYIQKTGAMMDPRGDFAGSGYSGNGAGKNNPAAQEQHYVGPLPQGVYTIEPAVDSDMHGPEVMWLAPNYDNDMYGRGGFGIHGDSRSNPGCASEGCIIMPRTVRDVINESSDRQLLVVATLTASGQSVSLEEE